MRFASVISATQKPVRSCRPSQFTPKAPCPALCSKIRLPSRMCCWQSANLTSGRSTLLRAVDSKVSVETDGLRSAQQPTEAAEVPVSSAVEIEVLPDAVDNPTNGRGSESLQPAAALTAATALALVALATEKTWLTANQEGVLGGLFVLGYAGIVFEELLGLSKSGLALFMAVCLWTLRAAVGAPEEVATAVRTALGDVSEVILFLVGAMTIVELVEAHGGFTLLSRLVTTRSRAGLLWLVGLLTFFTSAGLDNLTTTIVMVTLLQKLVSDAESRKFLGGIVVIAANAGGAWTPIGDVTTTMLWINGDISTLATMRDLFLPSFLSLMAPLALLTLFAPEAQGELPSSPARSEVAVSPPPSGALIPVSPPAPQPPAASYTVGSNPGATAVVAAGLGSLVLVPVFKQMTGLPPYMGLMGGLAVLWLLTDMLHSSGTTDKRLTVAAALRRIDLEGCTFFLGVLMAVSCLDSDGVLQSVATWLQDHVPNEDLVAGLLGLASAVVDNVPLVAAAMGMYDTTAFPVDSELWQLIAFCAGTGGSLLVIGSAAGVAFMGMEKADFFWYLRKISPWALVGYVTGVGVYLVERL